MKENLEDKIEWYINNGSPHDLSEMLIELYDLGTNKALNQVIRLALSDFGGITSKPEYQELCGLGVLSWGVEGIEQLTRAAVNTGGYRILSYISIILSLISNKKLEEALGASFNFESIKRLELNSEKYKADKWVKKSRECLILLAKESEKEDIFPLGLISNINIHYDDKVREHIFAALIARWFNLDPNGIDNYMNLIQKNGIHEIEYQNLIKKNPFLLAPFHAQIWSKPRFGESLVPDFLIRSIDDSYTVVEIERPDFPIITKNGELSAKSTHAKRQALDFRDWAISNNSYAKERFPNIYRPQCLVVIGRESELNEMQLSRLRQENESTQGVLKIVGFDRLYKQARATFDNIVNYGFERETYNRILEGDN